MAYFNHAFFKSFVATGASPATGTATSALTSGQLGIVDASTWTTVNTGAALTAPMYHLVQGSLHASDTIGGNKNHGGYAESVKSKGINPKYVSRIYGSSCETAVAATVAITLAADCHPCGKNLFLRLDVKGSPALRFLNHNAYAIGDSAGDSAAGNVPGLCCIAGQTHIDPALAAAKMGKMLIADPITAPFVAEKAGGGVTITTSASGSVVTATFTIEEALGLAASGNYVPSTDPVTDLVSVTLNLAGAYVGTQFGDCSFDTRDFFEKEPVQLVASMLDETGDPCNDCGTVVTTPGKMAQTTGEHVVRQLLLTERYMQSPYNQGNKDSARIREIEGSTEVVTAIDRTALYKTYYVQHVVPRFNNPSGVFDNDQYVYEIFVKCDDTTTQTAVENILTRLATAAALATPNYALDNI
tara:strand:+ start:2040 stop:3281 length:1242 start_codon:yes stop_codon:yes gene_type:complete